MGNSSCTVQMLIDDARSNAELAPALPVGGFADAPALSIANDVMQNMIAGGPMGQPFNWKWNRAKEQTFFVNSWQQDYLIPDQVSLGWLESCTGVNYSTTQYPKPVRPIECKRDLLLTNMQSSQEAKICWMQNDTMDIGIWGQTTQASASGLTNPGPLVVYTDPSTLPAMPVNPTTAVADPLGNLWVLTQYGTCGASTPFVVVSGGNPNGYVANPVYPTLQKPTLTATTVTDGSVVWTAVNPKGQGYRISPRPGQTGPVWLIQPIGQNKVPFLTSLQSTLDPVPDDYFTFFKQGFFAQCYRRSPDPKVRAKFKEEWEMWLKSLQNAVMYGANQEDEFGFVPSSNVMDTGYSYNSVTPSMPFGPWSN